VTKGFGRSRIAFYQLHDKPKAIWLYPLHPKARQILSAPVMPSAWAPYQRQADYLLVVKDNQPKLFDKLASLAQAPKGVFFPPDITLSQGHGRHEIREVYPFEITAQQTGFPYSAQAAVIIRTTHFSSNSSRAIRLARRRSKRRSRAIERGTMEVCLNQ
jgi:hypothetical protein